MKKGVSLPAIMLIACLVSGQDTKIDTTLKLSEHEVASTRLKNNNAAIKILTIDSLALELSRFDNLGSILLRKTTVAIREYTYNGLNTISMRGTSPRHTGVFWNGIQLNPANAGLVDLSLIPAGFFSDISLAFGGVGSVNGENSIGGSVHLGNEPAFTGKGGGTAGLKAGSYSDYSGYGHVLMSTKKWYSKTSVMFRNAMNNFYYSNLMNENVRLENAALQQSGFMQDLFTKIGKSTIVGGSLWYQDNFKEMPATITSKYSDAYQDDRSLRAMLSLKHYFYGSDFSLKGAFLNDVLHYHDPDSLSGLEIDSEIESIRYSILGDYRTNITQNFAISSGFNVSLNQGVSNNYVGISRQDQWGVFLMLLHEIPALKWRYNLTLRQDFTGSYTAPFTPSLGTEIVLIKNISARGSVSRNFRIPTFNDLFWMPGGNPDLRPETSWSEDVGFIYRGSEKNGIHLKMEITAFSSQVNDWILWVPINTFWSPQNIQQVWARGLESDITATTFIGKSEMKFSGGYVYTRSTNEKSTGESDQSTGKQLIYVPLHRFYLDLIYRWQGVIINPAFTYSGFRYISTDNDYQLPGYGLMDLTISKDVKITEYTINLRFDIINIFNTEYQAVQYYPMPGRHYAIILQCSIN
jgi:iron complex outermembrane receptor protein